MWDFFQRRICLTLKGAEWPLFEAESARVGLSGVEAFTALPIDDDQILGPHQSFSGSVNRILREFFESGSDNLLMLEDDCVFRDLSHLPEALKELPEDWDILYLGGNIREGQPERYSAHLFKAKEVWTTHAIAFRRKIVPYLLEHQPPLSETMFDMYLSTVLPRFKAYIVAPMVAYQRQHKSAIWGTEEDYTPIFEASDAKLR